MKCDAFTTTDFLSLITREQQTRIIVFSSFEFCIFIDLHAHVYAIVAYFNYWKSFIQHIEVSSEICNIPKAK